MLGINWDLFQGGSFAEAKIAISNHTDNLGLAYAHCVISDEPDVFFQQFDLEHRLYPKRCLFTDV